MKKRIFSILIALALCLTLLPTTAWADSTEATANTWDGKTDTSWYDSSNPQETYTLTTAAELAGLASLVNDGTDTFSNKTIYLDADIVLNEDGATSPNEWDPIGNGYNKSFQGTFDGNGHTVSNLYINITGTPNTTVYAGLFGHVNGGTVKNLRVENGTVTVPNTNTSIGIHIGGVVGYADTSAAVEGCSFSGQVEGTGSTIANVGGVVGYAGTSVAVEGCSFSGQVEGTASSNANVGGVVGYTGSATVKGCSFSGQVKGTASNIAFVGGVAGYTGPSATVEGCSFSGQVESTSSGGAYAGGVVGTANGNTMVKGCSNSGTITAKGNASSYAGGVAGYLYNNSTVESCYFLQENGSPSSGIGGNNGGTATTIESKPAEAFASGEVAWLLQNGQADKVWVQALGEDGTWYPALYALLSEEDQKQAYIVRKVTFAAVGGEPEPACAYVKDGGTVTKPADPTKESYALGGWYTDENCTQEWDFSTSTATADVTLYAKWVTVHIVTFDKQDGTEVTSQSVTNGDTVTKPTDPTREGYTFGGWYTDEKCTQEWDFSTSTVTADVTLYAKWTVNSSSPGSSGTTYTPTVEQTDNGTATVSPKNPKQGDTVTITPNPDAGYKVDSVTVTDQNGNPVKVTDNGDGTYSFTQPAGNVTVEVTFTEIQKNLPFTDVAESAYYYDAVVWAVENGIAYGTSATIFSPNAPCTRAQAVTFLWRAAGSPTPVSGVNPFTDVRPGTYYYEAVLWAVENGITVGTTTTTFSPDRPCTRAHAVTFLWRANGSAAAGSNPFADVADSAYYAGAVKWAVAEGITAGTTAATFSPDNVCTRAQIVTFLYRAEA